MTGLIEVNSVMHMEIPSSARQFELSHNNSDGYDYIELHLNGK
jgi:hypothetical protein